MKRTFSLLFTVFIVVYVWTGYQAIREGHVHSLSKGSLSDIAEEVTAIPLETGAHCRLQKIRQIKRDGEDIFLVSDRQLYHFNSSGKFLGQITAHCPQAGKRSIEVVDYVVDPIRNRLIVIGNGREVHHYDYDGQLLSLNTLPQDASWKTFGNMAYFDDRLWVTVDLVNSGDGQVPAIEQWLYTFDLDFREIDRRKLKAADLGRMDIDCKPNPEIGVSNGHVYVQSLTLQPTHILEDTLYLIRSNKLEIEDNCTTILPLRIGTRFLMSVYCDPIATDRSYTFCYDRLKTKAYNVQGGLDDNFYRTGKVPELQPMDVYNNTYCYCKSGKAVAHSFPERTDTDNPVLFILKIKA